MAASKNCTSSIPMTLVAVVGAYDLVPEAIVDGGLEDLDRPPGDDRALHATDELLALPAEHAPDDDLQTTRVAAGGHGGANA
jgi:hypothetical protein